jgi:Carboxypeptidase regulatory-like domain/TonB-dependent Receptor Plug Domain
MTRLQRALLLVLASASPSVAAAQSNALVFGRVLADSARPISGADVSIPALERDTRTDSAGRFRFNALPAGRHLIQIRALGYQPRYAIAQLAAGDTASGDIQLSRTSTTLDTVVVRAESPAFFGYRDFERRRKVGMGHYLTYSQLEKQRNRRLSDVLRMIPGVRLAPMRRGLGYVAVSRSGCPMDIYLDGLLVSGKQARITMSIDDFTMNDLGAVEVYSGPAETPAEFSSMSGCGTIVLWTRLR